MPTPSKAKRFHEGSDKLKKNKSGKIVSKAKSAQSKARMAENPRMKLRSQAVKEVIKGRNDRSDLFVKGSQINKDVKTRYEELLKKNNLPVKAVRSNSKTAKRVKSASKRKSPSKKRARRATKGGWFY